MGSEIVEDLDEVPDFLAYAGEPWASAPTASNSRWNPYKARLRAQSAWVGE